MARPAGAGSDAGAGYATLAAGVPARGAPDSALSFNSGERFRRRGGFVAAGALYRDYTGLAPPPAGVVCLGWQQLKSRNLDAGAGEDVGMLGTRLEEAGRTSAVLGNADSYGRPVRLAPLICADGRGSVAVGDVADTGIASPGSAGGTRTDYEELARQARATLDRVDVLVVDTGDTARIDREQASSADTMVEDERGAALARFDRFAADIAGALDLRESLLIIVSPGAPAESIRGGNFLTPFLAAGRGFSGGLVTSASTRRPGLVTNTDFLPTVLSFYGLSAPSSAVGAAMETSGSAVTPGGLKRLSEQVAETRKARWPIGIIGGSLAIVLSIVSVLCWLSASGRLAWPARPGRLARVIAPASVVLLAAPLSFVVASAFTYHGYAFPALFCPAFSLAVGLSAWWLSRVRRRLDPVVVVALLTVAVIIADQFAGGRLMLLPLLGSGGLEGLRFYGLTNIMVGVLVAMTVWAAAGIMRLVPGEGRGGRAGRYSRTMLYAALAGVALFTGLGSLGANLGGFVAAAVTFLVFSLSLADGGLTRFRAFVVVPAVTAFGVGAVIGIDAVFFRTHASRSVRGGAARLFPIVGRKLAIYAGQIEYLLVPALLLIAGIVAAALWMRRPGYWEERWRSDLERTAALYSLLVGGLVGLVCNDTGITLLIAVAMASALALCYYAASASFGAPAADGGSAPAPAATPAG